MQRKKTSNKKVLLVSNSIVLGKEVILHGISLSKRMGASLEVLHLLKPETAALASQRFKENTTKMSLCEPISYTQLTGEKDFTQEAVEYAKSRRNLLCVILFPKYGASTGHTLNRQKKFKEVTQLLNCPIVLYTDSPVYL